MATYTLCMTVSVDMDFADDNAAIAYIKNHTVFDLLNHHGTVGDDVILDEDGVEIYDANLGGRL